MGASSILRMGAAVTLEAVAITWLILVALPVILELAARAVR
jgi:hypothetical protein